MSYQVLARKWRPRTFKDMVGQSHVLTSLTNALDTDRLHHAYLFTGTRGVGKTTLARILAKCLNCEKGVSSTPCGECSACVSIDEGRFVDLIEVDAASRAKVEETRDLMDNVQYAPTSGRFKVYLIDEVHMFSNHSFNALLKTLEEPPPHVKFLLATTEPKKLPVTILSRCLQFNLKHLTKEQIAGQLQTILDKESISSDAASVKLIAAAANGSMRDALSLLDQAISYGSGSLEETQVREMLGTIDSTDIAGLLECLIAGDGARLLQRIETMSEHNPDYDSVLAEMLSNLHDIAVFHVVGDKELLDADLLPIAEQIGKEDVQLYYQIALTGRRDLTLAPDPKMGFVMTMVRMLAFRPGAEPEITSSTAKRPAITPGKAAVETLVAKPVKEKPSLGESDLLKTQDWKQIIDEMALAGLVREMAGHCALKEHSKDKVHLTLSPAQEHLLKTTQKDRLQQAIMERFGENVKLIVTVEEPEMETPAQQRSREEQEKQEAAVRSFNEDPDVKALKDTFDATVEQESIHPTS